MNNTECAVHRKPTVSYLSTFFVFIVLQYTPPTRLNCRVSRQHRRCYQNSQL